MTPKEKAESLVNQFRMILMDEDTECGNEILCSLITIKNSHIVVDEILTSVAKWSNSLVSVYQYKWWQKVKAELDAL